MFKKSKLALTVMLIFGLTGVGMLTTCQFFKGKRTYTPAWESLSKNQIPEWLKDAKFGVYTHWGVFSIPAKGGAGAPLSCMYKRELAGKKDVYDYISEKYGSPGNFGYKDFIPMFTAPEFDADEWVGVMHDAGAKFGGICVVHHDGFLLWNSKVNRWNSKDMGPKRDIYGEIAKAVRKYDDMKLLATFHHARTFGFCVGNKLDAFTEEEKKTFDIFDPEYKDFYWHDGHSSREDFSNEWKAKVKEVIDKYDPDLLWFDGLSRQLEKNTPPESYVREVFAYYFNKARLRGKDVTIFNKHAGKFNFPETFGLLSYENGRDMPEDVHQWFLIDRAIAYPWAYEIGKKYKDDAGYHIRSLIDLVSRGGVFLLSLTPKGDGSIPKEEKEIMRNMGKWLKINGEAIYATRPWKIPAEGPAVMKKYNKSKDRMDWNWRQKFSAQDIRFTKSKDNKTLYAIVLGWPEGGKIIIKSLNSNEKILDNEIEAISMIGTNENIKWERNETGLILYFPETKSCDYAYAFRIEVKGNIVD